MKSQNFQLISKSVFFPKEGILAIGDLHLGYENMLKHQGIEFSFNQLNQTKKDLTEIIKKIPKNKLKKIILLGDIKHYFNFDKAENFEVKDFLKFLESFVKKENIILIKGNHDKIKINNYKYYDYFIEKDIAFTHGDKLFPEILKKEIKTIVIGHFHPATTLTDKHNIKKEKYKSFLVGKIKIKNLDGARNLGWVGGNTITGANKNKQLIIVPSFFPLVEGSELNIKENYKHSFINQKYLKKLETFVIGENQIYKFENLKRGL